MIFTLGKKDTSSSAPRKGFKIGFKQFHMLWQQNALIESSVKGSLYLPKFKKFVQDTDGSWSFEQSDLYIGIEALFEQDGDFRIVFDPGEAEADQDDLVVGIDKAFLIRITTLEVGKDDNRVYLQISGGLSFENNEKLHPLLKGDFTVKKFRIYSDGSFELEGGSIPLLKSMELPLGPASITITAIHFGGHTQNGRQYKYFGFDGGISINPGGVDARGEGVKYFFTVDDEETNKGHDAFLQIEGIGINLIIPAAATPATATLLLEGFLSLKKEAYEGSISFEAPKARIAGGASMLYEPKHPAWLVDASLDLASPLPLGNTGLGFYGFRGLFGLRYLADKDIYGAANWYEYYKIPKIGLGYDKFSKPEDNTNVKTPFSIGAGAVLATLPDDGKAFSSRLFMLFSIPNLILLIGRANILGKAPGADRPQ